MKITKSNLKKFRKDFNSAVKELEEKYGVSVDLGNLKYDDISFSGKMSVTNVEDGMNTENAKFIASLKKDGIRFGLSEDDFNREFKADGRTFLIKGVKPRNRKYPILAMEKGSDSLFKFPEHVIDNQ